MEKYYKEKIKKELVELSAIIKDIGDLLKELILAIADLVKCD